MSRLMKVTGWGGGWVGVVFGHHSTRRRGKFTEGNAISMVSSLGEMLGREKAFPHSFENTSTRKDMS